MKNATTRWPLALLWAAFLLTGCATPETLKGLPPDQKLEQQIKSASPVARLDARGYTYEGPLPDTIAPRSEKTDFLGDIRFYKTADAIAALDAQARKSAETQSLPFTPVGENRIRHLIPILMRVCGRVQLQWVALTEIRRQTNHVEDFNRKGEASESLGTFLLSMPNRDIYRKLLDRDDLEISLLVAQGRYLYNQHEAYLESMGEWCPTFMDYVGKNGRLVATNDRYREPTTELANKPPPPQ